MGSLGESIHDGKDDRVTRGTRQPCDEVHSDVRPRVTGDGQGMQKPRRCLVTAFRTRTNFSCHNMLTRIPLQQRPPKGPLQQRHHMTNAGMTALVVHTAHQYDERCHPSVRRIGVQCAANAGRARVRRLEQRAYPEVPIPDQARAAEHHSLDLPYQSPHQTGDRAHVRSLSF